jgi:hypothetical protein
MDLNSIRSLDPLPEIRNPDSKPVWQKRHTKIEKKVKNVIFLSAGCSLLRAEGFSCKLGRPLWRPRDK